MRWFAACRPTLTTDEHLAALRDAVSAFARHAGEAGLDVPVPTCPDWTVRRLIGHQGMVHRWAAANLRGESIEIDATERAGRRAPSPVDWLRDGAIDLVAAITQAADDVRTVVFLNDAPPRAGVLGAAAVPRDHHPRRRRAVGGAGPLPARARHLDRPGCRRRRHRRAAARLHDPQQEPAPQRRADRDRSPGRRSTTGWLVEVGERPAVVTNASPDEVAGRAGVRLEGAAVAVYLALWNRSDELTSTTAPRPVARRAHHVAG